MQDTGPASFQCRGEDAVAAHGKKFRPCAVHFIDAADLLVGGILQCVEQFPAEQLNDDAVQIFCTGADDDLFFPDADASGAHEIGAEGCLKLRQAAVR